MLVTFMTYLIIFLGFFIIYLLWLKERNQQVCKFLITVIEWESAKHIAIIEAGGTPPINYQIKDSLPSYDRMMFTFRKLENYLPKEHLADYKEWMSKHIIQRRYVVTEKTA